VPCGKNGREITRQTSKTTTYVERNKRDGTIETADQVADPCQSPGGSAERRNLRPVCRRTSGQSRRMGQKGNEKRRDKDTRAQREKRSAK